MNIFIASDHGGYELKDKVKRFLLTINIASVDLGPDVLQPDDDYPVYAEKMAEKILENQSEQNIGILICRSGVGMSIAANKFKGIYAALCFSQEHAIKAREHNDANILCLDADYEDAEAHYGVVQTFLTTSFAGEDSRHGRRLKLIKEIEDKNFK